MHPDPEKGVVDLELRAHGIENLWVADASVIPSAIACNAQLTVQALAHYAVQRL